MGQWQWAKVRRVHTANVIKNPTHTLGLFNFRLLLFFFDRNIQNSYLIIYSRMWKPFHIFHGIDCKYGEWNTGWLIRLALHAIEITKNKFSKTWPSSIKILSTVRKFFHCQFFPFEEFPRVASGPGIVLVYILYVCVHHMKIEFGPVILFLSIS